MFFLISDRIRLGGKMSSPSPPVLPKAETPEPRPATPEECEVSDLEHDSAHTSPVTVVKADQACQVCDRKFRQPRVLACLHVFCLPCLEQQLKGDPLGELEDEGMEEIDAEEGKKDHENKENDKDSVYDKPPPESIRCPLCEQETKLTPKGVADLQQDLVMVNMLDMSDIEDMQIVCTSCKAREKAVARCSDCINFLCPNCVTAHQFMRCFENHKVSWSIKTKF